MKTDMYLEKEQKDLSLRRRQKAGFWPEERELKHLQERKKNAHDLWDDNKIFLHLSVYDGLDITAPVDWA